MAKIVNIRNIPEDLYRKLKQRATEAGMSLPAWALLEIRKSVASSDVISEGQMPKHSGRLRRRR